MTFLRHSLAILAVVMLSVPDLAGQDPAEAGAELREALRDYPHRIVFETRRDGNWELYLVGADGSGATNLTKTPDVHELNPKASPDGRHLAFVADTEEDGRKVRDVWVMDVDGTGRRKIADDARDPCWSPDGRRIAFLPSEYERFSTSTWATRGLRIHDLATGETRTHPNRRLEHLYTLTWSPDGEWFVSTVHGGMGYRQAILAIAVDGTAVHDLRLWGCRPDLAADGRSIAWGFGDYTIGVADVDWTGGRPRTRNVRRAVTSPRVRGRSRLQTYHADWSPDGRFMLFSAGPKVRTRRFWGAMPQNPGEDAPGWDLCIVDASGEGPWVRITTGGESNKEADWVPAAKSDVR